MVRVTGHRLGATMSGMDDLIARFRSGDPEAVREIYGRYAGAVRTVARSLVRDPELADDVVQQTFLKAWQAATQFDERREISPWLYAIARRSAIDLLRRERRPTVADHDPEADVGVHAVSFERTWEVYELRRALDQLPPEEREVMRLSHLLGLTHPEIAERTGVPLGTVKSRSARAHRRLAASLGHLLGDANRPDVDHVEGHEE